MARPPRLNVDLVSETLSVSAGFSLESIVDWWDALILRNSNLRQEEEAFGWSRGDPCLVCSASPVHLIFVDRGEFSVECMKCRNRIKL